MDGSSRPILNYLDQLAKFHSQQGVHFTSLPQLNQQPIDLFRLKKEVTLRGGFKVVTESKLWSDISKDLDPLVKNSSAAGISLRNAYHKYVLPFEEFLNRNASSSSSSSSSSSQKVKVSLTSSEESFNYQSLSPLIQIPLSPSELENVKEEPRLTRSKTSRPNDSESHNLEDFTPSLMPPCALDFDSLNFDGQIVRVAFILPLSPFISSCIIFIFLLLQFHFPFPFPNHHFHQSLHLTFLPYSVLINFFLS